MQKKSPWSLCLPTKSDLLLSNTARLKLSYPATPPPYPPLPHPSACPHHKQPPTPTPHHPTQARTHTHTTPTFATTRWSSRLSFCRSSLGYFSPESVQTFQTASCLCKSSGTKKKTHCEAMVTSQIRILKKQKNETLQTKLFKPPNKKIEGELYCCFDKIEGGTSRAF